MTFVKTDIIIRRERNKRQAVWVVQSIIVKLLETTEIYLACKARPLYAKTIPNHRRKQSVLPDSGNSWRWAKFGKQYYYDYDRLPAARQKQLGSKENLLDQYNRAIKEKEITPLNEMVIKANKTSYKEYLSVYMGFTELQSKYLAKAAAVVMSIVEYIEQEQVSTSKNVLFMDLAKIVEKHDIGYLPKNYRRLKEKVMAVIDGKGVDQVITLPRSGNSNALKWDDPQVLAWLMQLRVSPKNFPNSYIIRKVRMVCELHGKTAPSTSWCEKYLASNAAKFLSVDRWGETRRADRERGYIPIANALFAGEAWQADGTRVNFVKHNGTKKKEASLFMIVVSDVYSGDILGVHFDTKEDRWGYIHALKMAVNHTGHLPYELVVDRFPGHQTKEWEILTERMALKGSTVTVTTKKTGKAKAERLFSTLQTVFMPDSEAYYGEGVKSRNPYAHRTPKHLVKITRKLQREGWDFDAAWHETMRVIDNYRDTKYSDYSRKFANVDQTPRQLYQESDKPNVVIVEPVEYIEMFGTEKEITLRNLGMIQTEIQKIRYNYVVDEMDYDIIKNHTKVRMSYDMEDLSIVHLWEDSDHAGRMYLCEAVEEKAKQRYGPKANMSGIGKAKKRIKNIEARRAADIEEITKNADEIDLLLAQYANKQMTSSAETRMMEERAMAWKDTGNPKLPNAPEQEDNDDEDEPDIDTRRLL